MFGKSIVSTTAVFPKFVRYTDLSGADLVGANLQEAPLERANLEGAELLVVDFSNARLDGAIITSANGTYSNFSGATLSDASFNDTELQGAVFDRADLGGTRLAQSYDLSDSQIIEACTSSTIPPVLPGTSRTPRSLRHAPRRLSLRCCRSIWYGSADLAEWRQNRTRRLTSRANRTGSPRLLRRPFGQARG